MTRAGKAWNNLKKGRSGAALVVAIVIILVLAALSSSIFLAAYTLHCTAAKQDRSLQCHELAVSVSEALTEQILAEGMSAGIRDAADFREKMEQDWVREKYPLWFYLRTQILQGDGIWKYYDESGADFTHGSAQAFREMELDLSGNGYSGELDDYELRVILYWISTREEAEGDGENPSQPFRKASPVLVLTVECSGEDVRSVVTSKYALTVGDFDGLNPPPDDGEYTVTVDGNKVIYWNENWKFTLIGRR